MKITIVYRQHSDGQWYATSPELPAWKLHASAHVLARDCARGEIQAMGLEYAEVAYPPADTRGTSPPGSDGEVTP